MQVVGSSLWTMALAMLIAGCQPASRSSSASSSSAISEQAARVDVRPAARAKPLVDFARGAGGFPLAADTLPATRDELVASLGSGYLDRVALPAGRQPVTATGENYPAIEALLVDLTGGKIKPAYRPSSFKAVGRLQPDVIRVNYLSYSATPLQYVDGSTSLRMTARDVSLGLLRGRGEQAALVMTDAKDGLADFRVSVRDLRSMFLASAKTSAAKSGYVVRDVKLKLSSDDSRSLACELRISGFWLLFPTSLKFTGRIDIDGNFNARFSRVRCTGEDVGGVLIAGFIDNALKKYDGRIMPLATFPAGKIRIHDVQISVDDSLRVLVSFGS